MIQKNTSKKIYSKPIVRLGMALAVALVGLLGSSARVVAASPVYVQSQEWFSMVDMDLDAYINPPTSSGNPPPPPAPCSDSFGTYNVEVRHLRLPFSYPCGTTMFSGLEGHGFAEFSYNDIPATNTWSTATLHVQIDPMPGAPFYPQYLLAEVYYQTNSPLALPDDYSSTVSNAQGSVPFPSAPTTGSSGYELVLSAEIKKAIKEIKTSGSTQPDKTVGVRFYYSTPQGLDAAGALIGSGVENRPQIKFE